MEPEFARLEAARPPDTILEHGIRRFCVGLGVLALLLMALNLYFIHSEPSGSPTVATIQTAPTAAPPPSMSLTRQARFFLKHELDLDREGNFTTWLSSAQLAITAAVAFALGFVRSRRGWYLVALGVAYLSLDDLAQLHERVGMLMFQSDWRLGFIVPPYPWVLVFAPILIGFAVWMVRFLASELRDDPRSRRLTLIGLALMAASLPLEVLGGLFEGISGKLLRLSSTLEETCELIGTILLLYPMLTFLVRSLAGPRESRSLDVWTSLERERAKERESGAASLRREAAAGPREVG